MMTEQSRHNRCETDVPRVLDAGALDPTGEPPGGWLRVGRKPIEPDAIGLTEDGRLKSGRLAGLTMGRAIWVLSWPILVESLLNSMVGLTDTVLAAGLGEAETDAIGGASYIGWFIGLTIMAIGVGSTALISRSVGKGRLAVANATVGQTMLLQVLSGSLVAVLIVAMLGPVGMILNLGGAQETAFKQYLGIVAAGVPMMGVLFGGIACVRGAGDSLRPLVVMLVVNVVNIAVSWSLVGTDLTRTAFVDGQQVTRVIVSNPFQFNLGVSGIALGTLVAHTVGAGLVVALLISGRSGVRLRRKRLRPHLLMLKRLVRLGLPNFAETFGMWIGNFLILLLVGLLGAGALGTHVVGIRIEAFSFLPGFAMGTAAATLAGQYLGAGSPVLAARAVWRCALIASVLMGLFGVAFVLWPREIVGLLSSQEAHLRTAPALVRICGFVQVPFAIAIVTRSALRGAGDVRMAMTLTWVATYGIRLPAAYLLSGVALMLPGGIVIPSLLGLEPSLARMWLAMCSELVLRCVLFLARFLHGGWTRARV